jgi:soluble lytic murein transglycosylase
MQLMPLTAQRYLSQLSQPSASQNISELLKDAETNIRIASAYLADLSRHYQQDLPSILASYNAGEYAADAWRKRRKSDLPLAWIESIPFGETQNYVKSVLRNQIVYNELIKKDESKKN